jgi:hypothetical protein
LTKHFQKVYNYDDPYAKEAINFNGTCPNVDGAFQDHTYIKLGAMQQNMMDIYTENGVKAVIESNEWYDDNIFNIKKQQIPFLFAKSAIPFDTNCDVNG